VQVGVTPIRVIVVQARVHDLRERAAALAPPAPLTGDARVEQQATSASIEFHSPQHSPP